MHTHMSVVFSQLWCNNTCPDLQELFLKRVIITGQDGLGGLEADAGGLGDEGMLGGLEQGLEDEEADLDGLIDDGEDATEGSLTICSRCCHDSLLDPWTMDHVALYSVFGKLLRL